MALGERPEEQVGYTCVYTHITMGRSVCVCVKFVAFFSFFFLSYRKQISAATSCAVGESLKSPLLKLYNRTSASFFFSEVFYDFSRENDDEKEFGKLRK